MMMIRTRAFGFCLALSFLSSIALAQPTLTVSDGGVNANSNREWLIEATPDTGLFQNNPPNGFGGSLAVELAFEVTGSSLVGATTNSSDWPFGNPGNNPFTSGVTFGVNSDLSNDTVFAALGSDFFTTGAAVEVLTIETQGSAMTTLSWGGHTLLPGTSFQFTGSRIAQDGTNFDNFMGSLTLQDSMVACDFDGDGICDCSDIDALTAEVASGANNLAFDLTGDGFVDLADRNQWLADAGAMNLASGNSYLVGDANLDGAADVSDFNIWNGTQFTSGAGWCGGDFNMDGSSDVSDFNLWNAAKFTNADASHFSVVPEPAPAAMLLFGLAMLPLLRRRRA